MDSTSHPELMVLAVAFGPGIVAMARGHRSTVSIWVLNLIGLGILVVGAVGGVFGVALGFVPSVVIWLVSFVWSLGSNTRDNKRRDDERFAQAVAKALDDRERARDLGQGAVGGATEPPSARV